MLERIVYTSRTKFYCLIVLIICCLNVNAATPPTFSQQVTQFQSGEYATVYKWLKQHKNDTSTAMKLLRYDVYRALNKHHKAQKLEKKNPTLFRLAMMDPAQRFKHFELSQEMNVRLEAELTQYYLYDYDTLKANYTLTSFKSQLRKKDSYWNDKAAALESIINGDTTYITSDSVSNHMFQILVRLNQHPVKNINKSLRQLKKQNPVYKSYYNYVYKNKLPPYYYYFNDFLIHPELLMNYYQKVIFKKLSE